MPLQSYSAEPPAQANRILGGFTEEALRQVLAAASFKEVRPGDVLLHAGEQPRFAYFLLSGLVGIGIQLSDGSSVDVAEVSSEGVCGLGAVLGARLHPSTDVVDVRGNVVEVPLETLQRTLSTDRQASAHVQRYAATRLAQTEIGAACMARHPIEARLARWLLRAQSATEHRQLLEATQERLAQILGTQRPTVSLAANSLRSRGALRYRRGRIVMLDSAVLDSVTCECHHALYVLLASA